MQFVGYQRTSAYLAHSTDSVSGLNRLRVVQISCWFPEHCFTTLVLHKRGKNDRPINSNAGLDPWTVITHAEGAIISQTNTGKRT